MKTSDKTKLDSLQNPFLSSILFTTREITVNNQMVNVNDINEGVIVTKPSTLKSSYLLDDEPYTKVFTRAGMRLHIMALSPNAKSVFLWITYEIDPNTDYLEINRKRYVSETSSNYAMLSDGLKELIDASIIVATTVNNVYWINPLLMFKGDRLKKYPQNIVVR